MTGDTRTGLIIAAALVGIGVAIFLLSGCVTPTTYLLDTEGNCRAVRDGTRWEFVDREKCAASNIRYVVPLKP